MARVCLKLFLAAVLLQLITSCVDFTDFKSSGQYVVKRKTLYVRNAPSSTSLVTATYALGDTILVKSVDKQWAIVALDDGKLGFVSASSVRPIGTEKIQAFYVLDKLTNWKTWYFWVAAVVLVGLWVFIERCSVNFKTYLKTKRGVAIKGLPVTPVVLFVFGIMSGVLYRTWNEAFMLSIQNTFSFSPTNLDAISWVLWVQILVMLIALLFDILAAIFMSGVKWGPLLTLVDFLLGVIICAAAFFLTVSFYIVGIVLLVVFFAGQYTSMVSKNNRRVKLYQRPR